MAGVDGCPAGWFVVQVEFDREVIWEEHHLCPTIAEVLSLTPPPRVIGLDIPIGLLDEPVEGGRECDRQARKVLGSPRSSSIFSPPSRSALSCSTFAEGRKWGLNRQSYSILPKVREVEQVISPRHQARIREVHPEVSFFVLDGLTPLEHRKRSATGREARTSLLERHFFQLADGLGKFPRGQVGVDDILDAYICAWTAMRIFNGEAGCLPDNPPLDTRGLEMAIWY